MLLLGIDIGTSFIKVSVVDAATGCSVASAAYPETEQPVLTPQPGWAEQDPEQWWGDVQAALLQLNAQKKYNPKNIGAIGIAYQMHGLVALNAKQEVLRNSIIWCDSRAVLTGEQAFSQLGSEYCLQRLLNSPGNFTASKLAWVKKYEPGVYEQIAAVMLPGDFIAQRLTGEISTTIPALSEGIFWDFKEQQVASGLLHYFGIAESLIPPIKNTFSIHGALKRDIAEQLSLTPGIPVAYKAGDQPNNAFSLNVVNNGEVAATAGTSGVLYGVTQNLVYDPLTRINSFAHVNYTVTHPSVGVLLCINGAGHSYSAIRRQLAPGKPYAELNELAATVAPGADGLCYMPFGNGAERMLGNKIPGAGFIQHDAQKHTPAHQFRAVQEGVAFAFRYGLDIMRQNNMHPAIIKAGNANMFLSNVFTECFTDTLGIPLQLCNTDGSTGAALGAGIGAGVYNNAGEAFQQVQPQTYIEPAKETVYEEIYQQWRTHLEQQLYLLNDK